MWHVCGTEEAHTGFWWGNLRENESFEDPGIGEKIILNWIFRKWDGGHGLKRAGSGQGQVSGTCEGLYTFQFDYLAFFIRTKHFLATVFLYGNNANDTNHNNIPNAHCSAQYFSTHTKLHRIKPVA